MVQRVCRKKRPSSRRTILYGSGHTEWTVPWSHRLITYAHTSWQTRSSDERELSGRAWLNIARAWRADNSAVTTDTGTSFGVSSAGRKGRFPRRFRPCSKTDGAGRVADTEVYLMAANDSHRVLPSANIFSSVFFTVWTWRSTSPLDWAYSVLDVTCVIPTRWQNSRNSALANCVPLSDSNS